MKSSLLSALTLSLLCSPAFAQTIVVPQGMDTGNPGQTGLIWRNTAFHFQMIYDSANFLNQGVTTPISINRLRFRATGSVASAGGDVYTGVNVQMCSSLTDWATPSSTFASNRGADNLNVFSGTVTTLAAAGTAPNTYIIDIPLSTPFTYDPMGGSDLCLEVDSAAPLPAAVPNLASSSNATHLAQRISAATQTATAGTYSYFAAVCLMDYTPVPNSAAATKYGTACVGKSRTFYETLNVGSYDLGGVPGLPSVLTLTPLGNEYQVSYFQFGNWFTPVSAPIALTDDSLTAALPLGFTFNYPGGSTVDIKACSNGFVWLDSTQTASTFAGSPGLLVTEGARLAPAWHDMDPASGGAVYFDVDPSGLIAYVTWDSVPRFNVPAEITTMQCAIFANGSIEYRYQVCQNGNGLIGWSPGGNVRDGGSLDLSASVPFATEPDLYPLDFTPLTRPKLGGTFTASVKNIDANSLLTAVGYGFTQQSSPLSGVGMPGCFLNTSLDAVVAIPAIPPTASTSLGIPNIPSLAGAHVFTQSISSFPGINGLGLTTSNGIDLLLEVN